MVKLLLWFSDTGRCILFLFSVLVFLSSCASTPPNDVQVKTPEPTTNQATSTPEELPKEPAEEQGNCREYQTVGIIDGKRETRTNKACRQPNGSWKVLR
jgi:hypothetical protein